MMHFNSFSKRRVSLVIILLLLISSVLLWLFIDRNGSNRTHQHKVDIADEKPVFNMVNLDNNIYENFSTHLPLVIIDTGGEQPKADSVWDSDKGYFVPIDGDPYISGNISIIDNGSNINLLKDKPVIDSEMQIRLRGNSSLTFDKKQYFIKLLNKDGSKNKQNILGMGEDHEWILNISFIDKSLIRNYLGLNMAAEIIENIPEARFCEVIIKNNDSFTYEGVYLIMESIKRSESRIRISEYDNKFNSSSYILRRDRLDETGITLENYGRLNDLTTGYLEVKYPYQRDITEETINYITNDIDNLEKALFSDKPEEFYKYKDYIDENSFIDYFIINEFFANYDSGYNSTYIYKELHEKIKMGPVWDFDVSIDNYKKKKLDIDSTAMHDAPWFKQLLRDSEFVNKLVNRYHELREGVLSEEYLMNYIDEVVEYLGPAQSRDWERWGYFYTSKYLFNYVDENGNTIDRNTKSYEEEVEKIKSVIIDHGSWLDDNIDSLYQFSEFTEEDSKWSNLGYFRKILLGSSEEIFIRNIIAIIFIAIFIVSIVLISRE